jgi:hypothetical protein
VLENSVLRSSISGPKRNEMVRGWRKLHNEELQNLYSSPNIIRMIKCRRVRWAGQLTRMGRRRMHAYRILAVEPEGKRPVRRRRSMWEILLKWILDGMM